MLTSLQRPRSVSIQAQDILLFSVEECDLGWRNSGQLARILQGLVGLCLVRQSASNCAVRRFPSFSLGISTSTFYLQSLLLWYYEAIYICQNSCLGSRLTRILRVHTHCCYRIEHCISLYLHSCWRWSERSLTVSSNYIVFLLKPDSAKLY